MEFVRLQGLTKSFARTGGGRSGRTKAVDDVSFTIPRGGAFGLVGESGSGKTTIAQIIVGLVQPDEGQVSIGSETLAGDRGAYQQQLGIVFQNPFSSLDPKMDVYRIVSEPLRAFRRYGEAEMREMVASLLTTVGLGPDHMRRYPHEFSGGQRQRIAIARAISVNPRFLVLDEPTSALDVSVQARIINLLVDLQAANGLTYLFISHNIGVVRHICRSIGVMYRGRLLEEGASESIITAPAHPYTRHLIAAVPRLGQESTPTAVHPAPINVEAGATGCPFFARCPDRLPQCRTVFPSSTMLGDGHAVSCHLYQ